MRTVIKIPKRELGGELSFEVAAQLAMDVLPAVDTYMDLNGRRRRVEVVKFVIGHHVNGIEKHVEIQLGWPV